MKLHKTLLLSGLLGVTLHANSLFDNEFDKEFQKLHNLFNTIIQQVRTNTNDTQNNFLAYTNASVNIYTKDDIYNIEYQLAGIEKKDIELKLHDNNILSLKVEKENKKEDTSKEYHTKQISYNYINKHIQLPENVDTSKMDVKFDNGILKVSMPIITPPQPKAKIINIK